MKILILILTCACFCSCGDNKRITMLEEKVNVLNDSILELKSKFKIIEKPGDYYTSKNITFVGVGAGVNSRGYGNVILGNYAGGNVQGENNVIIGKAAAQGKLGDRNIVIGTHAGRKHGDFSNKLIIESSESETPLIYGDFKTDKLDINADLKIEGALIIVPTSKPLKEVKEGTIYYDLETKKLKIWNGIKWDNLN